MTKLQVVIRVDGSQSIGSGHVVRCLTLGNELRRRGAAVFFIMRERAGHLAHVVRAAGYDVKLLPAPADSDFTEEWPWGGASEKQDARETLATIGKVACDWLIVDHYGLGAEWEQLVRVAASRILVVDDRDDRRHDCDILLDQNYFGSATDARYQGKVPSSCRRLLGPQFALLQPEYAQCRRVIAPRGNGMRRVLVFFGGSDPLNQTARVVEALSSASLLYLAVDVVVGVNHPDPTGIGAAVARRPDTTIHSGLPTLAGLMVRADAFIGGGGGTTWERASLMLPGLVSADASNHEGFSSCLHDEGFHVYLGRGEAVTVDNWRQQIEALGSDVALLRRLSCQAGALTDGMGVLRVVRAMLDATSARHHLSAVESLNVVQGRGATVEAPCGSSTTVTVNDEAGLPVGEVCLDVDQATGDVLIQPRIDSTFDEPILRHRLTREAINLWCRRHIESMPAESRGPLEFFRLAEPRHESQKRMRISILSDDNSWINPAIESLESRWLDDGHCVQWVHQTVDLAQGDVCFILGFSRLLTAEHLTLHRHNLVVHEDALPRGRGWSPMTWQILEGRREITITLFEATSDVDAGAIYLQEKIILKGHELVDDWRKDQARTTCALCTRWIDSYPGIIADARTQTGEASYYRRRRPADSRLDPEKTIAEQFNLLRVVDNDRYPAFVDFLGQRYAVLIERRSLEEEPAGRPVE